MKKISIITLILIILYCISFLFVERYLTIQYSITNIPLHAKFDAAVIFYGSFDTTGNPDKESKRRLSLAVDLYHKGIIQSLIFVGGWRPSKKLAGSQLLAQEAITLGVKPARIFIDTHSRDTFHNWNEAKKIITENKFKKILLISSPFHLFRLKHLIDNDNDVKIFYGTYHKTNTFPHKSFWENVIDYNYHMISFVTYSLLPSELYQFLIEKIRK
ncbi:MAG: YdcF family protein [Spirochaetota bacterium]